MIKYLGDFPTGKTIYVFFETFAGSTGAPITLTGLATSDILVYKNGSVTQRASTAGYTLLDTDGIDFDGITGIHGFSIDTSDNTDAGFFVASADYTVVVSTVTVDGQTMSFIAATFSIDNRGLLRPTTATRTLDVAATGEAGLDFDNIKAASGATTLTNITVPIVTTTTTATNLTNAPTNGDFTATMKTSTQTAATASIVAFFGATWAVGIASLLDTAVSGARTVRKCLRLFSAILFGKSTLVGNTRTYRDPADTLDAVVATTDATGQRTAVTLDDSA